MKKMLWLDLETTGLSPEFKSILEVSAIVTDAQLNVIETFSEVVHKDKISLDYEMDDWCKKTHTGSGLLEAVSKSENHLTDVEARLSQFILRHFDLPKNKPMLWGNSVHFDKRFLEVHMPYVSEMLHYRMVDVSGMNEAFKLHKNIEVAKNNVKHRGLSDLYDSITLFKRLMEHVG